MLELWLLHFNVISIFCTALVQDLADDDLLNDTKNDKVDDNMKILDGYSDHGSGGSNFSHSRSRSLSGSFSVELSNLSGSSLGIYYLQW